MAEDKKGGGDFSLPSAGAIAIVLSLIGYFLIGPDAFVDERPNTKEVLGNDKGYAQDVDAKLWQDPFSAIKKDLEKSSSKTASFALLKKDASSFEINIKDESGSENIADHTVDQLYKHWKGLPGNDNPGITIIAAMVSGSNYAEIQEMRIRRRYALLSALSTLRFKPEDPEHIGYFKPSSPLDVSNLTTSELPDAIPFEWFNPPEHTKDCANNKQISLCGKVLVLWLNDTRFGERPIEKIREIFWQISSRKKTTNWQYAVIGPNDSGQLRALAMEVHDASHQETPDENLVKLNNIRFFSASATAEDAWILEGLRRDFGINGLTGVLKNKGITLTRTIADDKRVAEELVNELKLRQIDSRNNHVVLLSEWDTFYGRVLPLTFAAAYQNSTDNHPEKDRWEGIHPKEIDLYNLPSECESFQNSEPHHFGRVHCFSYVRGIDGKLPGNTAKEEAKSDSQSPPKEKNHSDSYDHPDGLSQKDYLRRLVDQIRELDHRLIQEDHGCFNPTRRCGISAIGVLGYDVYDKLAILQALRSYFPGKIFFTIGLDALYSSPKELPSTHNLIVASSFGLNLRPEIQKNVPPFRDSYQTSFFLATLLAITNQWKDPQEWLKKPRIFEIGRKGPIDLSGDKAYQPCNYYLSKCDDIQPSGVWSRPRSNETILRWILLLFGILLLYRASWKFREIIQNTGNLILIFLGKTIKKPLSVSGVALFVSSTIILALIWFIWVYPNEEPWLWADGISIWPVELLRILALILSVSFLMKIKAELKKSNEIFEENYKVNLDGTLKCVPLFAGLKSIHSWKPEVLGGDDKVDVKGVWGKYREKNVFHARVVRSLFNLVFFMTFSYCIILLSGGLPVPARGDLAFYLDKVIVFFAGISVLLLTMLVVDASRLGDRFITHLNGDGKPSDWPSDIVVAFANDWGINKDYVIYWIDVRFVAEFTEVIGKFVWYPIIPLLLMVAARSSIFDDSVFSYGLVISFSILLLYLFSCAFWLQSGANKMRAKAIGELNKKLRTLRGATAPRKEIDRLERLIVDIEDIKKGAFTPFMQQPQVRAVLAVIGGGSGLPLLEHFF